MDGRDVNASACTLTTLVDDLPGIPAGRADAFRDLGLRCLADLLLHLPSRYERTQEHVCIADLDALVGDQESAPDQASLVGEVVSLQPGFGRRRKVEAILEDESGKFDWCSSTNPGFETVFPPAVG